MKKQIVLNKNSIKKALDFGKIVATSSSNLLKINDAGKTSSSEIDSKVLATLGRLSK